MNSPYKGAAIGTLTLSGLVLDSSAEGEVPLSGDTG